MSTVIEDLLQKTSRTFALTIPYLPQPTRDEVGIAYLLFRIIDTFEDAVLWAPALRLEALPEHSLAAARSLFLSVQEVARSLDCNELCAFRFSDEEAAIGLHELVGFRRAFEDVRVERDLPSAAHDGV